jgi:hypothetical protein
MIEAQPGILGPVPRLARYLTFSLLDLSRAGKTDLSALGL